MLMPGPLKFGTVLAHNAYDIREFPAVEPIALGQRNLWFQPDLRIVPSAENMDVNWLSGRTLI